jgi:hypothetical protein
MSQRIMVVEDQEDDRQILRDCGGATLADRAGGVCAGLA